MQERRKQRESRKERCVKTRRSPSAVEPRPSNETCFFCDGEANTSSPLHAVSRFDVDGKVRGQGEELIAVYTKDVMSSEVVETVRIIPQVGKSQYDKCARKAN